MILNTYNGNIKQHQITTYNRVNWLTIVSIFKPVKMLTNYYLSQRINRPVTGL